MTQTFESLAECADQDPNLQIEARVIPARRRAGGLSGSISKLCGGGPRSQNDYLEIASQFHTLFLSDVCLCRWRWLRRHGALHG